MLSRSQDQFNNFFSQLVRKFNIYIKISTDIELNSSSKELVNAFKNNHNIEFLGPVDAESLMKEIGDSDLIISPHGAISCIAGYYNKNIIVGKKSLKPRLTKVPTIIPLPKKKHYVSIYELQKK